MLNEEKRTKTINTNAVTRYKVFSVSRDRLSWRSSFSLTQICLQLFIKIDGVII